MLRACAALRRGDATGARDTLRVARAPEARGGGREGGGLAREGDAHREQHREAEAHHTGEEIRGRA